MNVSVASRELISELTFLERVVSKKPTLPVLSNVLLQAHEGWLHLSATDLEIGLVTACQATVGEDGQLTLPAKKLIDIAKSLADTDLEISLDPKGLVRLKGGTFNSRLQSLPAHDFPRLQTVEGTAVSLPRSDFRSMLGKVQFAVDAGDARHTIKGALLTLPAGDFALVATDGKRLALAGASRVGDAGASVIFPSKTVEHLVSLLNEPGDRDVVFTQGDRHLFFEIDGRMLISRTLEGTFPNYERIIPKNAQHTVTVDRITLMKVIERAVLIAEAVQLTVQEKEILVTSTSVEVGDSVEAVPAAYEGETLTVKVRGEYVIDFLKAADNSAIQLSITDVKAPLLFSDGKSYVNVVMGMRS